MFKTAILAVLLASASVLPARVYATTAYCACKTCAGKWSRYGLTASGQRPVEGRTIAGPRNIPFGTRVFVSGVGERIVEDRMSRRHPDMWDISFRRHEAARQFGVQRLEITILK